ncbi:hypothetical protein GCM10020370_45100 [Paenibacillus hodogayensis]
MTDNGSMYGKAVLEPFPATCYSGYSLSHNGMGGIWHERVEPVGCGGIE